MLVGDPQQLPATVLSKRSKALAFERSLFERLMLAGWPLKMLSVQYRMHPQIRAFPSAHFYQGNLQVRCKLSYGTVRSSCSCFACIELVSITRLLAGTSFGCACVA